MKILKNTTVSDIVIEAVGVTITASSQLEIDPINYVYWATVDAITEITPHITSGDIVVNDGVYDLTVANGFTLARAIDFIRYPHRAFNQRFASEPERSNEFEAKNTQEAIEETIKFGRTRLAFTKSGAVTTNTFLWNGVVPSNIAGATVPSTISNVKIAVVEIANQDISTFEVGIYEHDGDEINLTLIKTYSIVASRTDEEIDGVTALDPAKQLAVKLVSGSAKNLSVSIAITGKIA